MLTILQNTFSFEVTLAITNSKYILRLCSVCSFLKISLWENYAESSKTFLKVYLLSRHKEKKKRKNVTPHCHGIDFLFKLHLN